MLLYISIAAIFVSTISFYYNWKTNKNSIYLSLLILFIAIHGVSHSLLISRQPLELIAVLFNNFSPLYFLAGPMIFFYVRGTLLDDWRIQYKHLWHFIPFLIMIIVVAPYWFTSFDYKLNMIRKMAEDPNNVININTNKWISNRVSLLSRSILLLGYSIVCFYQLYHYHPSKSERHAIPKNQLKLTLRWLVILVTSIFLIASGYLLFTLQYSFSILRLTSDPSGSDSPFGYLAILAFLLIPITLIFIPQILYGIPIDRNSISTIVNDSESLKEPSIFNEYIDNVESENINEPFATLAGQIMNYLNEQKPFLNPTFSMDDLARALDIPRHHLYYCMNRVMKIKFPELRKKLRIEHAKKMLQDGKYQTLSIEGIGFQSGFSSRSNFFTVFKEEVGMTPSAYIEQLSSK